MVREQVGPRPKAIGAPGARGVAALLLGLSGLVGCNAIFGIDKPTPIDEAAGEGDGMGGTVSTGGIGASGRAASNAGRSSSSGGAPSGSAGSGTGGTPSGGASGGMDSGDGGDGGTNGGTNAGGRANGGGGGNGGDGSGGTNGGSGGTNGGTSGDAGDGGTGGNGGNGGSPSGGRASGGRANVGGAGMGGSGAGMGGSGGRSMGGAGMGGSGGMAPVDPCDLDLPGPEMVLIPAGQGPVGTTNAEITDAQPVITVMFDDYCIDRTEVTLGQYKTCVTMGGCVVPTAVTDCNYTTSADTHPINCMDHARAAAYCTWAGKRLPSEKEWEHAARGSEGRTWPWGEQAPSTSRVNYMKSTSPDGTTPVGSLPTGATPGTVIHDLAGNVWEWTDSIFCAGYQPGATCQPGNYTARGGSYGSTLDIHISPSWHDDSNAGDARFGFRCVYGDGEK